MGDPRRLRRKYDTPMHPWNRENMELEKGIKKEYALKNKQELWRMNSLLKNLKLQAKKLIALRTKQSEIEKTNFIKRLQRLGLVQENAKLDDVLSLTIKDVIERRLQSRLFRLGLARSMKQARQFIVHNHVMVSGKKVNAPSYMVKMNDVITFYLKSTLASEQHPERVPIMPKASKEDKVEGRSASTDVPKSKSVGGTEKQVSSVHQIQSVGGK